MKYNFSYFKKLFENSSIMDFKYIYIYGDLRFFLAQNVNDKKFIHKLLNYFISKKITIIVPSFSYTKDKFYLNKTKSKVGFLSNYILKNFKILEDNLTYYRQTNTHYSSNYKKYTISWWRKRLEAHKFFFDFASRNNIKIKKNLDVLVTKLINVFL